MSNKLSVKERALALAVDFHSRVASNPRTSPANPATIIKLAEEFEKYLMNNEMDDAVSVHVTEGGVGKSHRREVSVD